MAAPSVKILPMEATAAELADWAEVNRVAFGPDGLIEFCFHRPGVEQESEASLQARHLQRMAKPQYRFCKAVDAAQPDGPMLGTAVWYWCDDLADATAENPMGPWAAGAHLECLDASIGALQRWRVNHFRTRNQPYLQAIILAVRPEAQRRGIGAALLQDQLDEADRRGMPTFIDASPAGLGLYLKMGWAEVTRSTVNLRDFGGPDEEHTLVGLIRPPRVQ